MSSGYFPLRKYDFPEHVEELISCANTVEKILNDIRPAVYDLECTEDGINDAYYLSDLSNAVKLIRGVVRE